MTRGRPMTRGIKGAMKVARARGPVTVFRSGTDCVFNFMIETPVRKYFVRLRYVTTLKKTIGAITDECRDIIDQLRSRAGPGPDFPELWLYNKHGSYRYFRITSDGIIETDCCGVIPAGEQSGVPSVAEKGSGGNRTIGKPVPSSLQETGN